MSGREKWNEESEDEDDMRNTGGRDNKRQMARMSKQATKKERDGCST